MVVPHLLDEARHLFRKRRRLVLHLQRELVEVLEVHLDAARGDVALGRELLRALLARIPHARWHLLHQLVQNGLLLERVLHDADVLPACSLGGRPMSVCSAFLLCTHKARTCSESKSASLCTRSERMRQESVLTSSMSEKMQMHRMRRCRLRSTPCGLAAVLLSIKKIATIWNVSAATSILRGRRRAD